MSNKRVINQQQQTAVPAYGSGFMGALPELASDALGLTRKLIEFGEPVVELKLPFRHIAVILDANIYHQIMSPEHKTFVKDERSVDILGAVLGNGIVTNRDVHSHRVHRKLIQPGFHFRRLQDYATTMSDYTQLYLKGWGGETTRDISEDMYRLTMFIVCKTLFDIDMETMADEAAQIGKAMDELQVLTQKRYASPVFFPSAVPTPLNLDLKRGRRILHETVQLMFEERARSGGTGQGGDLMTMLLEAKYDDGSSMSDRQVMDELVTLFSAGHETTSNALTWTFYLLATHPDVCMKLQAETDAVLQGRAPEFSDLDALRYTDMVLKESMRMLPPVWTLNMRSAQRATEIQGLVFPKNKRVWLSPYALHHFPQYFPNPDQFDPERFSEENEKDIARYAYSPFGLGPRTCIGNSFAMMEAKIILASFAQRFNFSLDGKDPFAPQPQITLSNTGGMPLRLSPRQDDLSGRLSA